MGAAPPAQPGAQRADPLLRLEDVHYTYPGAPAATLTGLSLGIPPGRRCGLIGENGSGKTTLFLLAMGLLRPQRGRILWRERPLSCGQGAQRRPPQRVGLVFQNPEHQLVATTVAEDLSFGLLNLGLDHSEVRERIQQAAASFGLEDLLDRPVHMLSLGQKKRLSLADVMVLEPELLLLDEPTAFLSPGSSRDLLGQLRRIHGSGVTTVVASHDMDFLHRWADWLFVIDRGRLVLEGEPGQVFCRRQELEALGLGVPPALDLSR